VSDHPTTPDVRFAALAQALLTLPGVTHGPEQKRAFGSHALKVNGSIFAMLVRGQLVVKLPRTRVDTLIAAGAGQRYDPRRDGRHMKEWLALAPASDLDWLALAQEALAFVGSVDSAR
jgi:hypothetical protein